MNWLYNLFTRQNYYFVVFEIPSKSFNDTIVMNPKVIKWIKKFFFWKFARIQYNEGVHIPKVGYYQVFGNAEAKGGGKINRNVFIFMVELINELKTVGKYPVSKDFPFTKKIICGTILKIYKIKKFDFKKEIKKIKK